MMTPATDAGFTWNNEAEPLQVWIETNAKFQIATPLLEYPNPDVATSHERRTLEFEVTWPADVQVEHESLSGYVVYNICEKDTGVCMIRRQDFVVPWRTSD